MNKVEFGQFVMALKTFYPKENLLPNNQAVELWYRELQDIPYIVAEASLRQWVTTNRWSPSIADIREKASTVQNGIIPDWGEGWQQVIMAIRKYGMYQVAEAMESFDPITKQCVERLGFRNICLSENINTDRANFRLLYENLAEMQKADAQIPITLSTLIETIRKEPLPIGNSTMVSVGKENEEYVRKRKE